MRVSRQREREFKLQLRAWAEALKRLPIGDRRKTTLTDTYLDLRNELERHGYDLHDYFPTYDAFKQYGHDNAEEMEDILHENAVSYANWPISKILSGYSGGGGLKGEGATGGEDTEAIDPYFDPWDDSPDLSDLDTLDAERRERAAAQREREDFLTRTLIEFAVKARDCDTAAERHKLVEQFRPVIIIGLRG